VHKTEHFSRLLHLSATGNGFCIVIPLLVVTAVSVCGGEPVKTLAMADLHQSPLKLYLPAATSLPSGSDRSLYGLTNSSPATSCPIKVMTAEFSTDTRLEKRDKSAVDPFQFVHKNLATSSRSLAFSVQAGYGRIWDEKSMLPLIAAGHQETGCAYVAANISF
jgi:hypothetical protein